MSYYPYSRDLKEDLVNIQFLGEAEVQTSKNFPMQLVVFTCLKESWGKSKAQRLQQDGPCTSKGGINPLCRPSEQG